MSRTISVMSKIRINELARELEVKPTVILDLLPELGVQDKKTHSSSLEDDVALAIRTHVLGGGSLPPARESEPEHSEPERSAVPPPESRAVEEPKTETKTGARVDIRQAEAKPADLKQEAAPEVKPDVKVEKKEEDVVASPRPVMPLRPPLSSGSPLVPPVVARGIPIPARPNPPASKPGTILSGPRQPLPPPTNIRPAIRPPAPPLETSMPALPGPPRPVGPPSAIVSPGPVSPNLSSTNLASPNPGSQGQASPGPASPGACVAEFYIAELCNSRNPGAFAPAPDGAAPSTSYFRAWTRNASSSCAAVASAFSPAFGRAADGAACCTTSSRSSREVNAPRSSRSRCSRDASARSPVSPREPSSRPTDLSRPDSSRPTVDAWSRRSWWTRWTGRSWWI